MNRWTLTGTACALAALCPPGAHAQSDSALSANRPASTAGGKPDFGELVNQDVANGYYSQAEGDALKGKLAVATEHIQASYDQMEARIGKDASMFASSDQTQTLINQAGSYVVNGQGRVGGTPEEIQEQAEAAYTMVDRTIQLKRIAITDAQPILQDAVDEVDRLLAARSQAISNNPSLPASVKQAANTQAAKVHDYAAGGVQRSIDSELAKVADDQDRFENNKGKFVDQVKATIQNNVKNYGDDYSKWPKPDTPPQQEARNEPVPSVPPASEETPAPPPPPQTPVPTRKPPVKGTIPDDRPDPAFNAHRNDPGDGTTDDGGAIASGVGGAAGAAINSGAKGSGSGKPTPPASDPIADAMNSKTKLPPPAIKPRDTDSSTGDAAGAAFNGAKEEQGGVGTETPEEEIFRANRPGNIRLVDGDQFDTSQSSFVLPSLVFTADQLQSIEYGDTVTTAALLPIYAGYRLSDHTGDAMMSLDLQMPAPSSVMTVPSLQMLVPSSVVPFGMANAGSEIPAVLCGR